MTDEDIPTLVETEWLDAHLDDPDLRVLDCTVHLDFDPETGARQSESGREDWERAHIPGSAFADLLDDLSETEDPAYPLQLPTAEQFAESMSRLGVGDDSRVVLYDAVENQWAARVWWMLRAFGFDHAGILNGGWSKWIAEDRPVSSEPPDHGRASFTAEPRSELIADKEDVAASIDDDECCLLNALRPEDYAGTGDVVVKYGRPGRIPGSVNVPTVGDAAIVDSETNTYSSPEELRRRFAAVGATDCERTITYCGGGVAASSAAFALCLIGVDNVAVYDGSLSEWGNDPELPMVTD